MTRRALVIGAAHGPGEAAARDADRVAGALAAHGFDAIDLRTGERATRDGIVDGYRALIAASREGDAAVFYFAGHGARAQAARAAPEVRALQFLQPTDHAQSSPEDVRLISTWELSMLQAQLTARTRNVTTILDCCYAERLSRQRRTAMRTRAADPVPSPLAAAVHAAVTRTYGSLRAIDPRGNSHAVRAAACAEDGLALEGLGPDGAPAGVFTARLLELLEETRGRGVPWRGLAVALARALAASGLPQRPVIEGPIDRVPFEERTAAVGAVPVHVRAGAVELCAGRLAGVGPGDVYAITAGGPPAPGAILAELDIATAELWRATATVRPVGAPPAARPTLTGAPATAPEPRPEERAAARPPPALPVGAVAWPLARARPRAPVAVCGPSPARDLLDAAEAALARSRWLRVAAPAEHPLATVRALDGGGLAICDAGGVPLEPSSAPWTLSRALEAIERLARAAALLEATTLAASLAAAADPAPPARAQALPAPAAPCDFALEWGTAAGDTRTRGVDGQAISLADEVYVTFYNHADRPCYFHALCVGPRGDVALLTSATPSGLHVPAGQARRLGADDGLTSDLELCWPLTFPRDRPAEDATIAIATAEPVDLRLLETAGRDDDDLDEVPGDARGPAATRAAGLPAWLAAAVTSCPRAGGAAAPPLAIIRWSWLLLPFGHRVAAGEFCCDEDPLARRAIDVPVAWVGPSAPPTRVRIAAHLTATDAPATGLRLDVLACTRAPVGAPVYQAWTVRVSDAEPAATLLQAELTARDVLELFVWSSRGVAAHAAPDLAALLPRCAAGRPRSELCAALAIRDPSHPWPLASGACAALALAAASELQRAAGALTRLIHVSRRAADHFAPPRGHGPLVAEPVRVKLELTPPPASD